MNPHFVFLCLPIALLSIAASDCLFEGSCETKVILGSDPAKYVCVSSENESGCNGSDEDFHQRYHPNKSCRALGYTDPDPDSPDRMISPRGEEYPGKGGYFAGTGRHVGGSPDGKNGGGSYDYTWTCPDTGSQGSAPIPKGKCESEFERYAEVFGCNQVGRMRSACIGLHGCLGDDTAICAAYE